MRELYSVIFALTEQKNHIIVSLVGTTPHWGGKTTTFQGNAVVFMPPLMVLALWSVLLQL
jgi:hypothetical protein